jgi:hypothetical protein
MKTLFMVLIISFLTACGGAQDRNCERHMVNNNQPITGTSGLTLDTSYGMYMTFPQMESIYENMKQCVGVYPTTGVGPTVYYKDFSKNNLGAAWAFHTGGVIWVNNDNVNLPPRNCHSDQNALKHEIIHYLLYISDSDVASNTDHGSDFFTKCDALGVRTENGIPY